MKFGRPLAIIVHYTVQFNLECCKSSVSDMGPNTILKIKKIIIRRLKSEITQIFQHTIIIKLWWTTCYHSPLHGTIQCGVLQKLCVRHGP